jgi:putative transposase
VLWGFVRGLSLGDVWAALAEAMGRSGPVKVDRQPCLRAGQDRVRRLEAACLGGIELEYLFLGGSHFPIHPGARAEPVPCAWGLTTQGSPVLVGLTPGASEGHDPWASFLGELVWTAGCDRRCR